MTLSRPRPLMSTPPYAENTVLVQGSTHKMVGHGHFNFFFFLFSFFLFFGAMPAPEANNFLSSGVLHVDSIQWPREPKAYHYRCGSRSQAKLRVTLFFSPSATRTRQAAVARLLPMVECVEVTRAALRVRHTLDSGLILTVFPAFHASLPIGGWASTVRLLRHDYIRRVVPGREAWARAS